MTSAEQPRTTHAKRPNSEWVISRDHLLNYLCVALWRRTKRRSWRPSPLPHKDAADAPNCLLRRYVRGVLKVKYEL